MTVIKKYPEAHEVILLCGTNDSKDRFNTPPEVFKRNMEGILRIAAMYDKEVIICYIPDLNGFGAPDYSQESQNRIDKYNAEIKRLILDYPNIIKGSVDLRGLPVEFYADGVHFKNIGYKEIAKRIFNGIKEKREFFPIMVEKVYSDGQLIGYFDAEGEYYQTNEEL